jgi:uncharacterized protein (TIGR02453 family)
MPSSPHFTPRLFAFLRALKRNNDRAWFQANKGRYVADLQQPMLRFIADFAAPLRKISRHYVADPRPVGGSMFRIHRDTRFARDKSPYKTHASAHFRHAQATKDVHAPGFYFHLEPGDCFIGGGIWLPEAPALKKVRDAIACDVEGWRRVRRKVKFIEGDALVRPPQGYDPAHPFIEDLKRKSHFAHVAFSETEVCGPRFLDLAAEACRAAAPLMRFLTEAVELEW